MFPPYKLKGLEVQCSGGVNVKRRRVPEESRPVTAEWAAASRSSAFTICCSEVTGRYWIWPSWLTAIWTQRAERALSFCCYRPNRRIVPDDPYLSHLLLLQKGPVVLVLDDVAVWHLRDGGAVSRTSGHLISHQLSSGHTSRDTDLDVVAVGYDYVFLRDQVLHSVLWDDILNLENVKNELERSWTVSVSGPGPSSASDSGSNTSRLEVNRMFTASKLQLNQLLSSVV